MHLTIPFRTLLGLADAPGEAARPGPLHADTCRDLARHRTTEWGVIITSPHGQAMAHGAPARARPAKPPGGQPRGSPASAGGWAITLTTRPIAPTGRSLTAIIAGQRETAPS